MINEKSLWYQTMHGKKFGNPQGFQILFKEQEGAASRKNALLYQDILRYSISYGTEEYFRSRQISQDWLLRRNAEFRNRYQDSAGKTNIPNRAEYVNPRVSACLQDLVQLDLIISRPSPAERGKEMTTEYKFTHFGYIIALLLECDLTKLEDHIYNEIFEVFEFYWTITNSSADLFSRIFYKRLKSAGLFEIFISHYKSVLHKPYVRSRVHFFQELMLIQSQDECSLELWNIFKESLEELRKENNRKYEILLFNLKLHLERIQGLKVRALYSFEKFMLSARNFPELVVLEGYCSSCGSYSPAISNLLEYLEAYFEDPEAKRSKCRCGRGRLDFEVITEQ